MPELPEVETIRRQLAPHLEGRVLERLEVGDPRWCAPAEPAQVAGAVGGRLIERLARRGKYLVVSLSDELFLVMHLRMTGNLLFLPEAPEAPAPTYLRARLWLGGGASVCFCDARRFGTGVLVSGEAALAAYFASRVGVEPLGSEFSARRLAELASGRKAPVKAFLLAQTHVAGIGNIYADEALFRARIHPLRPAGELSAAELERLCDGVVAALRAGIDAKGASIDDFRHTDGARGSFQDRFLVHRRAGERCHRCGDVIEKLRAGGRSTYVCGRCQALAVGGLSASPPRRRAAVSASPRGRPARARESRPGSRPR